MYNWLAVSIIKEKRTKSQQNIVIFCKMLPAFKLEVI